MKIEIASAEVTTRNFTSKAGKPITIYEQAAYIFLPDEKYPRPLKLNLDTPTGYAPGVYTLSPKSFYTDRYDTLAVRPILAPVQKAS